MSSERTANAVDAWIGRRMRARRQEIGITQERLADLMGITFQQVQKYERGVNRIAASRLYDVCKILDISLSELMEGYESDRLALGTSDGRVDQFLALPEAAELVTSFVAVRSVRMRRRFVDLISALVVEQSKSASGKA
ncbi:MAG: helix-turn-helix domain-containing protein [Hyphomonadaceae bacterium]|nr:helix-turn-helix domain-containing protein [Hyphomonadaceae bacterium]